MAPRQPQGACRRRAGLEEDLHVDAGGVHRREPISAEIVQPVQDGRAEPQSALAKGPRSRRPVAGARRFLDAGGGEVLLDRNQPHGGP